MSSASDITEVLKRAASGDSAAMERLIPMVYASLRQLAHRQRAHEGAHTLETTALVHEAYLTLARQNNGVTFADRAHLYAYMSRVMRHVLVDHARRKNAQKRQVPEMTEAERAEVIDVLAIDEALQRLAALDQRLVRVVELRLFAGLSNGEIAEATGVTTRTVERDWLKARTFLSACLTQGA
ncbi:ECF-type sigma factor [Lysobacter tyrosinilyticus]